MYNLKARLKSKKWSIYKLSKESGVPQPTLSDIFTGKTPLCNCNAYTLSKISNALGITIDRLLQTSIRMRQMLEFRNQIIELRKTFRRPIIFVSRMYKEDRAGKLFQTGDREKAIYLCALMDHDMIQHQFPLGPQYDHIRSLYFEPPVIFGTGYSVGFEQSHIQEDDDSLQHTIQFKDFAKKNKEYML